MCEDHTQIVQGPIAYMHYMGTPVELFAIEAFAKFLHTIAWQCVHCDVLLDT